MSSEPVWGAAIAWYLFLAGLGAGAFVTAAFLTWRHPDAVRMRRTALVIAPIAVAIGLVLLMFDAKAGLHDPLRFALLLSNFGSVMTWGVVFLSVFMVVSIVALVLNLVKRKVPTWLSIVGVVFSLCVAVYTGALLGVCRPYPLWNNALLPVLFLVSALSSGAAAVLLISACFHPEEFGRVGVLKKLHFCLPVVEVLLVASLLFVTSFNSDAGFASVASMVSGSYAPLFWIGLVVIGLVLPLALEAWLLFFSSQEIEAGGKERALGATASAGVIIGGFLLRYVVVVVAVGILCV